MKMDRRRGRCRGGGREACSALVPDGPAGSIGTNADGHCVTSAGQMSETVVSNALAISTWISYVGILSPLTYGATCCGLLPIFKANHRPDLCILSSFSFSLGVISACMWLISFPNAYLMYNINVIYCQLIISQLRGHHFFDI